MVLSNENAPAKFAQDHLSNDRFYDYPNFGFKGEYTAHIISELNYNYKAEEDRIYSELLKGNRFEHHINAWLEFIIEGASIIPRC
jgi:hypothetical protein